MADSDKKEMSLASAIQNFSENLSALREFLNLVSSFLSEKQSEYLQANIRALIPMRLAMAASDDPEAALTQEAEAALRHEFGAEVELIPNPGKRTFTINIAGEHGKQFGDAMKGLSIRRNHEHLLYRNSLISLISSAEWFLSQVLRGFFEAYPEAAGVKEKTLTLEDLRKIGSIDEAENYLITLRVDEIMWGGYEDWIKYLRSTVKISMGYIAEDEPRLIEIFQRRNVLVHNNGIVNPTYIAKIEPLLRQGIQVGQELQIDRAYVDAAIDLIERNFVLIAAELWKKLKPKDENRANVLTDLTIKSLMLEKYRVAEGASRFTMDDKQLPERSQLIGKLNFWQTLKWVGKFEEVKTEIEEADFSAKEDLFQLARLTLLDLLEEVIPLIEGMLGTDKLPLKALEEWPIFKLARQDPRIIEIIEVHRAAMLEKIQFPDSPVDAVAAEAIEKQVIQ